MTESPVPLVLREHPVADDCVRFELADILPGERPVATAVVTIRGVDATVSDVASESDALCQRLIAGITDALRARGLRHVSVRVDL
jgi:hypothetical protein